MGLSLFKARIHQQAVIMASTLLFALPALAQPPIQSLSDEPARDANAQRFFDEGQKAAAKKDWTAAQKYFQASLALKPHWKTAANLGQAELELKQYKPCAEHLSLAKKSAPDSETTAKIQTLLDLCTAQLGIVRVSINQVGNKVWVDGQPVGVAPIVDVIFVEAGPHTLTAGQGSQVAIQKEFIAARGTTTHIDLVVNMPQALPDPPGIQPQETDSPAGDASATWRKAAPIVAIGTGAIGLVALGLGIGYGVKTADQVEQVQHIGEQLKYRYEQGEIPCVSAIRPGTETLCAQDAEARDRYDRYRTIEIVGFVTAGAAALTEVIVALQWPSKKPAQKVKANGEKSAMRIVPSLSKEQNGLVVYGVF